MDKYEKFVAHLRYDGVIEMYLNDETIEHKEVDEHNGIIELALIRAYYESKGFIEEYYDFSADRDIRVELVMKKRIREKDVKGIINAKDLTFFQKIIFIIKILRGEEYE